jgi:dynein heavy chain
VLDVQPKQGGGGGGETREEAVLRLVKGLQAKLPAPYKPDDVRDAIKKQGGVKPLNICLQQEVHRHRPQMPRHRPHMVPLTRHATAHT